MNLLKAQASTEVADKDLFETDEEIDDEPDKPTTDRKKNNTEYRRSVELRAENNKLKEEEIKFNNELGKTNRDLEIKDLDELIRKEKQLLKLQIDEGQGTDFSVLKAQLEERSKLKIEQIEKDATEQMNAESRARSERWRNEKKKIFDQRIKLLAKRLRLMKIMLLK